MNQNNVEELTAQLANFPAGDPPVVPVIQAEDPAVLQPEGAAVLQPEDPVLQPEGAAVLQPEDPVLERFRSKRNAVREIDAPSLIDISNNLTVIEYNALRRKLFEINGQLEDDNFQPQANVAEYKSPRNLVGILVANGDAINRETVKKLFAIQHEFKWCTETGDPDQFSFYGFCNDVEDAGGEDVMTYDTRKAHVISRLYHAQEKLHKIRHLPSQQLCPPVYVLTEGDNPTWTRWKWCNNQLTVDEVVGIGWISNQPLREYITQHSERNTTAGNLPNETNHLYWVVFEEDDFDDNHPHVNDYGRTQIYVGSATRGIKDRWAADSKSHSKNIELSRNVMYNMMNYDQNTLQKQLQLVDLRLLLHKANQYNQEEDKCGLFIMQHFENLTLAKSESKDIKGIKVNDNLTWEPKNMLFGVNGRD